MDDFPARHVWSLEGWPGMKWGASPPNGPLNFGSDRLPQAHPTHHETSRCSKFKNNTCIFLFIIKHHNPCYWHDVTPPNPNQLAPPAPKLWYSASSATCGSMPALLICSYSVATCWNLAKTLMLGLGKLWWSMVKLDLDLTWIDVLWTVLSGLDLEKHWRLNVLPSSSQTFDQNTHLWIGIFQCLLTGEWVWDHLWSTFKVIFLMFI